MLRKIAFTIVLLLLVSTVSAQQKSAEECGFPDLDALALYIVPADLLTDSGTGYATGPFYEAGGCQHGNTHFNYWMWGEADGRKEIVREGNFEVYGVQLNGFWYLAWQAGPFQDQNTRFLGVTTFGSVAYYYYVDLFHGTFKKVTTALTGTISETSIKLKTELVDALTVPVEFLEERSVPYCRIATDYELSAMDPRAIEGANQVYIDPMVDMSPEGSRCQFGYIQVFDIADPDAMTRYQGEQAEYGLRMYFIVDGELIEPYTENTNVFYHPAWIEESEGVTSFVLRRLDAETDRYIRFTLGESITTEEVFPFTKLPDPATLRPLTTEASSQKEMGVDTWHCFGFSNRCDVARASLFFTAEGEYVVVQSFLAFDVGNGFSEYVGPFGDEADILAEIANRVE